MKNKKQRLILHDTSFVDLMARRIFNILLVANPYDAFMLEDDGRIDEKIFGEYAKLGLRFPPRFTQVASREEAELQMETGNYDLLICMPGTDNNDVFDIARLIKEKYPSIPIVVLTPFSHGVNKRMEQEDLSIFEYVFCWLGNTELLLSIIKLIEDKMNLEHDTKAGVQMILLVEDSIRFYSSLLPLLYKFVLQQSLLFATEALNSQLEQLRMRGRPKIVLARNYEEAQQLWEKFGDNTLGVISDCRFPKDGKVDEFAGLKLLTSIRQQDSYIPLVMESSESGAIEYARSCRARFIDKNSKKLDVDLRNMLSRYFGFGDFIFRDYDEEGNEHEYHTRVFIYLDAFCEDSDFEKFLPDYKNLDEMKEHALDLYDAILHNNFELSGRYYSKRQGGSYEISKPTGSIDLGFNKSWLENRIRLSLLMTDILHTERWDSYGVKDALNLSSWGYGESRKVILRFSYSFGKQKFNKVEKNIEELNRL